MIKYEAQKKHDSKCTKFCFKFNNDSDSDIINTLKTVGNKTEYIRSLVRGDEANIKYFAYERIKEHLIKRMLESAINNRGIVSHYDDIMGDIIDHRLDTWLKEACFDIRTF